MYTNSEVQSHINTWKQRGDSKPQIIRELAPDCLDWPYVWASNGEMCTPEWRRNRIPYCKEQKYVDMIRDNCPVLSGKQEKIYTHKPDSNEKIISPESCVGCKWYGCRCFDCQGFVHWL